MAACRVGEFAKSKAGHDKEEIFVIINKEDEYVYLSDGKSRTIDKPKKKKLKHIQVINKIDEDIFEKLETNKILQNEDIKKAIKIYKKSIEN